MGNPLWFLIGCIGIRLLLAFIVKHLPINYLPYAGVLGLMVSFTMATLYVFGLRPTGMEVGGLDVGKGRIWWNDIRPIHAAIYLVFACYALQKKSYSYVPLEVDAVFGLSAWYVHYYL